jgi:hypothetical protein
MSQALCQVIQSGTVMSIMRYGIRSGWVGICH